MVLLRSIRAAAVSRRDRGQRAAGGAGAAGRALLARSRMTIRQRKQRIGQSSLYSTAAARPQAAVHPALNGYHAGIELAYAKSAANVNIRPSSRRSCYWGVTVVTSWVSLFVIVTNAHSSSSGFAACSSTRTGWLAARFGKRSVRDI